MFVHTQGVLYDLFECLYSYMDSANLTSIPIYFISPVADSSLAYSNIFAEWYETFLFLISDLICFSPCRSQNKTKQRPFFIKEYEIRKLPSTRI